MRAISVVILGLVSASTLSACSTSPDTMRYTGDPCNPYACAPMPMPVQNPCCYAPQPVMYAPPPAPIVVEPPVYVEPEPPAPVYVEPPVYIPPPPPPVVMGYPESPAPPPVYLPMRK
ncbi:MAG: hypothetical protein ACSHX3_07080 [Litorimonas sp.]